MRFKKNTSLANFDFTSNKQDAAKGQQEAEEKQSAAETKKQQPTHLLSWSSSKLQTKSTLRLAVFSATLYTTIYKWKSTNGKGAEILSILNIKISRHHSSNSKHNLLNNSINSSSEWWHALINLKMCHISKNSSCPYVSKKAIYLTESVIKSCLGIIAQKIRGGTATAPNVPKLAWCDNSMQRRCSIIAASLKEIVLAKLRNAPCFELQLDVTTHITSQAQLIVSVRFPDKERVSILPSCWRRHHCFKNIFKSRQLLLKP